MDSASLPTNSKRRFFPTMHQEKTVTVELDGEWFIASCLEVPEANGQSRTPEEARQDLAAVVTLVSEVRRTDAL